MCRKTAHRVTAAHGATLTISYIQNRDGMGKTTRILQPLMTRIMDGEGSDVVDMTGMVY